AAAQGRSSAHRLALAPDLAGVHHGTGRLARLDDGVECGIRWIRLLVVGRADSPGVRVGRLQLPRVLVLLPASVDRGHQNTRFVFVVRTGVPTVSASVAVGRPPLMRQATANVWVRLTVAVLNRVE